MRKNLDKSLRDVIIALEKQGKKSEKAYFKAAAKALDIPTRNKKGVNVARLQMLALKGNKVLVVPGKVLGTGNLDKKIDVYAYSYSEVAEQKLKAAGVKIHDLYALIKDTPKNITLVK